MDGYLKSPNGHVSTLSSTREPTLCNFSYIDNFHHFNSRLHEGADGVCRRMTYFQTHFNSRLRKGADTAVIMRTFLYGHFNSRLRKGADALMYITVIILYYFNSRLRKGADGISL